MIFEAWALVPKNLRFAFVAQNLVKSWVWTLLRSDFGCVCESLLKSVVFNTAIFNFHRFSSVFHDVLRFSMIFFGFP